MFVGSHRSAGLYMAQNEATEGFSFNSEAMPFIEQLCHFIDFENFQSYVLGLLASQCDNRGEKSFSNPVPLVARVNNNHPYEYLTVLIFDVGIAG